MRGGPIIQVVPAVTDLKREIAYRYQTGQTIREIADEIGYSRGWVFAVLVNEGVARRDTGPRGELLVKRQALIDEARSREKRTSVTVVSDRLP